MQEHMQVCSACNAHVTFAKYSAELLLQQAKPGTAHPLVPYKQDIDNMLHA